ncbi:MAG: hypothetical protein U5K74_06145 [Gemmatimonadaceae bacterium]|nr:hypothetical protein [Gemmatimonadaceae bacterium]
MATINSGTSESLKTSVGKASSSMSDVGTSRTTRHLGDGGGGDSSNGTQLAGHVKFERPRTGCSRGLCAVHQFGEDRAACVRRRHVARGEGHPAGLRPGWWATRVKLYGLNSGGGSQRRPVQPTR